MLIKRPTAGRGGDFSESFQAAKERTKGITTDKMPLCFLQLIQEIVIIEVLRLAPILINLHVM
ncbi:MAG TPA: hypothetical protein DCZ92_00625 [Elusimicrobia bacterium]|nr:MAG: hypothetical protein A2016_09930 [Elusimicrobia bacterium GWF2_62_30]HBA59330.1 hypothetical protein [Elusimicrobiota bacterium]